LTRNFCLINSISSLK